MESSLVRNAQLPSTADRLAGSMIAALSGAIFLSGAAIYIGIGFLTADRDFLITVCERVLSIALLITTCQGCAAYASTKNTKRGLVWLALAAAIGALTGYGFGFGGVASIIGAAIALYALIRLIWLNLAA